MRVIVVLVVAGVGLAAAKRKRGYLRGVGKVFRNKASTQRNRALKHLAKLDREVAAMKSERARDRKIQEREGRHAADEAAGERADEEENQTDTDRRRLSVFSASARRKRAAGHLRQVEKKHSHDPHPGVTGELEYDHPVSYAVAVAKKHAEEAAAPALQLRDGRA